MNDCGLREWGGMNLAAHSFSIRHCMQNLLLNPPPENSQRGNGPSQHLEEHFWGVRTAAKSSALAAAADSGWVSVALQERDWHWAERETPCVPVAVPVAVEPTTANAASPPPPIARPTSATATATTTGATATTSSSSSSVLLE